MPLTFAGTFRAHAQRILALVLDPGGLALLTACKDVVRWWDLAGGHLERELRLGTFQGRPIHAAAFSPDAARLLVCRGAPQGGRAVLEVHHLGSGAREVSVQRSLAAASVALALHPDGHRATLALPDRLDVVDLATGAALWSGSTAAASAFTRDGSRLVSLARGRTRGVVAPGFGGSELLVRDLDPAAPPRATRLALDAFALAVHPDGARVLLAGEHLPTAAEPDARGLVFVTHRIDDGARIAVADIDIDPVTALSFGPLPQGPAATSRIALGHAEGNVTLADWSLA